jgi:hypothetical protein
METKRVGVQGMTAYFKHIVEMKLISGQGPPE